MHAYDNKCILMLEYHCIKYCNINMNASSVTNKYSTYSKAIREGAVVPKCHHLSNYVTAWSLIFKRNVDWSCHAVLC